MISAFSNLFLHLPLLFSSVASTCSKPFLGFKTWFYYFPDNWFNPNTCEISKDFQLFSQGSSSNGSGIIYITLALLDDLLRLAALVAVAFVIYGGISYVTSQGSPDNTKKAQQTIINALIGLVIAIIAATVVGYLGGQLSK